MMKVGQNQTANGASDHVSTASQAMPTTPEQIPRHDLDAFITRFKELDTNHNGVLEKPEYDKAAASRVVSYDQARHLVTKDNSLTQSDFVVARAQYEHGKHGGAAAPVSASAKTGAPAKIQTHAKSHLQTEPLASTITAAPGSVDAKRAANQKMGPVEAKAMIRDAVDKSWDVIQPIFNFKSKEQAYALFFADASRESAGNRPSDGKLTFLMDKETAVTDPNMPLAKSDPARAYGPFQAAVTAFDNDNPRFNKEPLPTFPHAKLTPENYYDAEVSTLMGIRKIAFYAQDAQNQGLVSKDAPAEEIFQYGVAGHNMGYAKSANKPEWKETYGNEVKAMYEWYKQGDRLYDDQVVYTGDPRTRQYLP